jgi:hypothetical protein
MSTTTTVLQKNGQSSFLRTSKVTENRIYDYAYGKLSEQLIDDE